MKGASASGCQAFLGAWLRCRNNLGFRLQRSTITRRSKLAVMSNSRGKCHAREITANFNAALSANLKADANLGFVIPTYVFATPVLGGQASVSMIVAGGHSKVGVDAALAAAIGPIGFTRGAGVTEAVTGFADLIPQASLRWNLWCAQRHDLHHRRYPGGRIRTAASGQSWHRSRSDRRWRGLHLFQSANRA